jgi:methyltransferase (TIGR00027 family)
MRAGQPSQTARGAAAYRAIHQTLEGGVVFADPFAVRILDEETRATLDEVAANPALRPMRLFIVARSRFSEDALANCIARGVRQVVVLGAGLDTFSLRNPFAERGVLVFEVDHPATQAEKHRRLTESEISVPPHLVFAPCDFETRSLGQALDDAGFDARAAAFFIWLGVTPYLTSEAVENTLGYVADSPGGAEIVFDYVNPPETIEARASRDHHERLAARVAAIGEQFRGYFETPELHRRLTGLGFDDVEDWGPRRIRQRLAPGSPRADDNGGHILRAARHV